MTEELRNHDLKDSARRKLMRGAFVAPAVLTLHSGSAIAATSAATCLVNQNGSPTTKDPVLSNDGTYFRYRLWVVKNNGGTAETYWVMGADLTAFVRMSQTPFVSAGSWWRFNPVAGTTGFNQLVGTSTTTAPSLQGYRTLTQDGPWVSLRVNSNGAVTGAGASGTGSAVSGSCWNSFAVQSL